MELHRHKQTASDFWAVRRMQGCITAWQEHSNACRQKRIAMQKAIAHWRHMLHILSFQGWLVRTWKRKTDRARL